MLKSNIDVFFCEVISLFPPVSIVSFYGAWKEVSTENIENSLLFFPPKGHAFSQVINPYI